LGFLFFIIQVAVVCWVLNQLVNIRQEVETISKKLDLILSPEQVLKNDEERKDS
jgi:hypothetical protein